MTHRTNMVAAGLLAVFAFACGTEQTSPETEVGSGLQALVNDSVLSFPTPRWPWSAEDRLMADPSVYVHSDGYIYMSGTSYTATPKRLSIYRAPKNNVLDWQWVTTYDPGADPDYTFCAVWGGVPNYNTASRKWELRFTARRGGPGNQSCDSMNEAEQSTWIVEGTAGGDLTTLGSRPWPHRWNQTSGFRGWTAGNGCPASSGYPVVYDPYCMRIEDKAINVSGETYWAYGYYEGTRTGMYPWMRTGGNGLAIATASAPGSINIAVPLVCSSVDCFEYEEGVNEGPGFFKHSSNGYYYLFYASGYWDGNYATRWIKGTNPMTMSRGSAKVPIILFPHYNASGLMVENRGHPAVADTGAGHVIFYHHLPRPDGVNPLPRDIRVSELRFDGSGNPVPVYDTLYKPPAAAVSYQLHKETGGALCVDIENGSLSDIKNGSLSVGARLKQSACGAGAREIWDLMRVQNQRPLSYYMLRNRQSGLCMASANGSGALGTNIVQEHCEGSNNQLWTAQMSGSWFRIQSKINTSACAAFPSDNTYMQLAACSSAFWLSWR